MAAGWTLGNEESAVTKHEGSRNFDGLHEVPEQFPRLPPDALIDEPELLHFLWVEKVPSVEENRMAEELSGAFKIELFEDRPFGGDHQRIATVGHVVHIFHVGNALEEVFRLVHCLGVVDAEDGSFLLQSLAKVDGGRHAHVVG